MDSAKCLEAEASARIQVSQLQKQLESYQNVYGQSGDVSKQLEEKESEVKKLRLQVTQHAQAETALYTELEKLSTAWEALDKEVKSKLFDLVAVEDRLSKGAIEVPFANPFFLGRVSDFRTFRKPNLRTSSTLRCETRKPSRMSERILLGT